ncbi:three-prime repair exonuclease 1-like [Harmonia axyridis]|uniref:three-prime repair exonuclease 1-like n=1 Tax=Harmonia axyridis TaxID=115357 RepID=UPI001E276D04|nr:three-prime repair exonuclease 1-like [Harmonia axyridis]
MSVQREPIYNFAFIDLETTGFPSQKSTTRITELSISIVESKQLSLGIFPTVLDRINLCFNPCKFISPYATRISGLSNHLLQNQSRFSLNVVKTIDNFLNLHKKPICFVAHNGDRFDYPILRAEINNVKGTTFEDILCIDSLKCFRDLHVESNTSIASPSNEYFCREEVDGPFSKKAKDIPIEFSDGLDELLCKSVDEYEEFVQMQNIQKNNETTPQKRINSKKYYKSGKQRISFKLKDIYKRLTSNKPKNSHQAEVDVEYLIQCAIKYGDVFTRWANDNAKLFKDIPQMKPAFSKITV